MNLIYPLAALLGIEAEALVTRFKRNAIAGSAIALFALIGVAFLLVAIQIVLAGAVGALWSALIIAGTSLLIALVIYVAARMVLEERNRRETERRRSNETTALVTTAALTALPIVLKSPALRSLILPLGGALAAYWLFTREHDPDSADRP